VLEISWDEALDTVASRLSQIKAESGPETVVFACATPSGSAFCDFYSWLNRFGHAFGSPNRLSAIHICTWNVMLGSKHTFGTPTPPPDFENTRCILLWGANPRATYPTFAQRISRARGRGAKLIVIDPCKHNLARDAGNKTALSHLLAAAASNWDDAAEKARYLLDLFAATLAAQDPRETDGDCWCTCRPRAAFRRPKL
jgi:anaerobic selenocysteine-containing dehydrogenase